MDSNFLVSAGGFISFFFFFYFFCVRRGLTSISMVSMKSNRRSGDCSVNTQASPWMLIASCSFSIDSFMRQIKRVFSWKESSYSMKNFGLVLFWISSIDRPWKRDGVSFLRQTLRIAYDTATTTVFPNAARARAVSHSFSSVRVLMVWLQNKVFSCYVTIS